MTKEQIEKFEAGRDLDALVAKQIFGDNLNYYFVENKIKIEIDAEMWCMLPCYSMKDIEIVITEICKTHQWHIYSPFRIGKSWRAGLKLHGTSGVIDFIADGETMALAICRAALMMKFNHRSCIA